MKFSASRTRLEGRGSSYQAGQAATRGQLLLLERTHKETSQRCQVWGMGHEHWGRWWLPGVCTKNASPSKGSLHSPAFGAVPYDYFSALLLDVLLKRTPLNWKSKHCARMNWPFHLPSDIGSAPLCGLLLLALGHCLPCAPSCFFSLCIRTTQSTLFWILLTPPWVQVSKPSYLCQGIME